MEYVNAMFMGRSIPEKNPSGKTKDGRDWTRFDVQFKLLDGNTMKSSMFKGPKKGLCVTSLTEGDTYNIGYVEESYTGQDGEERHTKSIKFVSKIETKTDSLAPVAEAPKGNDLLSPEAEQQIAPQGEMITNTPVANIALNPNESELLDKLKGLDQAKVTEVAFKETCDRVNASENRKDELWRYYCEKVREK